MAATFAANATRVAAPSARSTASASAAAAAPAGEAAASAVGMGMGFADAASAAAVAAVFETDISAPLCSAGGTSSKRLAFGRPSNFEAMYLMTLFSAILMR